MERSRGAGGGGATVNLPACLPARQRHKGSAQHLCARILHVPVRRQRARNVVSARHHARAAPTNRHDGKRTQSRRLSTHVCWLAALPMHVCAVMAGALPLAAAASATKATLACSPPQRAPTPPSTQRLAQGHRSHVHRPYHPHPTSTSTPHPHPHPQPSRRLLLRGDFAPTTNSRAHP